MKNLNVGDIFSHFLSPCLRFAFFFLSVYHFSNRRIYTMCLSLFTNSHCLFALLSRKNSAKRAKILSGLTFIKWNLFFSVLKVAFFSSTSLPLSISVVRLFYSFLNTRIVCFFLSVFAAQNYPKA